MKARNIRHEKLFSENESKKLFRFKALANVEQLLATQAFLLHILILYRNSYDSIKKFSALCCYYFAILFCRHVRKRTRLTKQNETQMC